MSSIPKSLLPAAALTTIQALFIKHLASGGAPDRFEDNWQQACDMRESRSDKDTYFWLGAIPGVREWIGERQVRSLGEQEFTLKNKKYELTLEVDREVVEDADRFGELEPPAAGIAERFRQHPGELIVDLLNNGFTSRCYDGQYFFDTSHSEGDSGTQSNKGTTALTGGASGSLATAFRTMMGYKDDQGKPLGIRPNLLIVDPNNFFNARQILNSAELIAAGLASTSAASFVGNANVTAGLVQLMWSPRVDPDNWYLLDTTKMVKPIVWQWRIRPQITGVTNPESESVFDRDTYKYGGRSRCAVGYGLWQAAYGAQV